jgi:phage terminase large subunit-like protein
MAKETRGERVCRFIETKCRVPEGDLVGKKVKLSKFQRRFILELYDNPHGTDTAILSIARKNAKTALIAFLVLAHTVGPEAKLNSRIISGAMSRKQAAEVYNYASKCVLLSPDLSPLIRIVPSQKKLIGLPMNVEYEALSAEAKTALGGSPIVAVLDEVGQIRGPQSDFVDAITTAQGAYANPLLIYISTQSAKDSDFFSLVIDDALLNKPPKTVCHLYAADADCGLMDIGQWKKANPAMGEFRSEADMRKQAAKAVRMPSFESAFRNLNLNQRVEAVDPFISRSVWEACAGKPCPIEECEEIYGGLDLSGRTDLTCKVLYGRKGKIWNCYPFFWTPEQGLKDRARRDKAPYDLWVKQGFLRTTPGATVGYEYIVHELPEILPEGLIAVAFDRWRVDVFKKELERAGMELPMVEFGQGFKDMAPALDALEDKILNKLLRHGNHPVMNMCAANAVITKDPAGGRKLDKSRATGRIDGMQALSMAAGIAEKAPQPEGPSIYETRGIVEIEA